ncbi:MAG: RNA-binding transcriptional accessory protein [Bacilli bacterium]|nr:RNA-binding transcriptional accessory protein [Bacilli bacterium]
MDINRLLSAQLSLPQASVNAAVALLDDGNTVPFIARYRKEATGNLTDADLRKLEERLAYLRNLQERMDVVLASIEEQGKLTDELRQAIESASTLAELEDLYRPYKPKRKTRASIAKEKGLEELARYIEKGKAIVPLRTKAKEFVNPEKGVNDVEEAIQGAEDILAEEISDNADYRAFIRRYIFSHGFLCSKEIAKDEKDTYANYASYREAVKSVPPHRLLAINRGEKEKCLRVSFDYETEAMFNHIAYKYLYKNDFPKEITDTINDALKRLILPSVETEVWNEKFERAEDKSLEVFKANTRALLLYPPLKDKKVLGFDPGIRTGCKWAVVNTSGIYEEVGVSFITRGDRESIEREKAKLLSLLRRTKPDYIALGNGTASRESEAELRDIIKKNDLPIKIAIVSESGASVYSASALAEKEFPELPVEKRSAISLARRLQDPLNELVKIDPKSIGVGQYQHDMNQKRLEASLHAVVEDCVNAVGANLNTASISILSYIAGITPTLAANILDYLKEHGRFHNRQELKKVAKLGPKAFAQCAGFLRIYDGDEPLDATGIHPESYQAAKEILAQTKIDILHDNLEEKQRKLASFSKTNFLQNHIEIGEMTLDDILEEILTPGRDIRLEAKTAELEESVRSIEDLKVGMVLQGTVRNIMDFGMFVDINVHLDGLVHISEVANRFVRDISSLYQIGDIVKVKVIGVDLAKKRISLSIKQVG